MKKAKISKLKMMRLRLKLSQTEMARRLNISQPSYCNTEKNGVKQIETLRRYARALGCDPRDLIEL